MSSDLISRSELKKAITKATYNFEQIPIRVDKVQEIIDSAPTVTDRTEEVLSLQNTIAKLVEGIAENTRPKGEWVVEKNKFGDILHCSICGARPRRSEYGYDLHDKFCNECGATMEAK